MIGLYGVSLFDCLLSEVPLYFLYNYLGNHQWWIYNLGSGKNVSVLEMIAAVEKVSGRNISYVVCDRREGDVEMLCCDPSRAEKELQWKATRSLEQMCSDSWNWQQMNPNGYTTKI